MPVAHHRTYRSVEASRTIDGGQQSFVQQCDVSPEAAAVDVPDGRWRRSLKYLAIVILLHCGCSGPSSTESTELEATTRQENAASPSSQSSRDVAGPLQSDENSTNDSPTPQPKSFQTAIRFQPLSDEVFPSVIPQNGSRHGYATILESLGSGGAAVDVDLDGMTDALVAGGGDFEGKSFIGLPVFFLRNRRTNFSECTAVAGLSRTAFYHHGLAAADFDQDGFHDLLITGYGGLQLFRNLGDGTFEDVSSLAGLAGPGGLASQSGLQSLSGLASQSDSTWSASAGWGDFNNDGHLDLYVTAYVNWSFENDPPCFAADGVTRDNCSPKLFDALPDSLLLSHGNGTFEDATLRFSVRGDGKALGVVVADVDLDGFVDAYVGNDVMMNFLYRNESGQSFSDCSISSGAGVSSRGSPDASMGVDIADYNLDGRPDIWAANFEMESFALYENQGNLLFRHMSESTGISAIGEQYVGWGSAFADFDLDGDEDLCVCNGNVVRFPEHSPALQRMVVLDNVEGVYFEEVTAQVGESFLVPRNGRGLAMIDWNNDGLLDLLTTPTESPAILYQNVSSRSGNWLTLSLIGTQSARQPIGTLVIFKTSDGSRIRQLKGGGSYASTSVPEIHFAVPEKTTVGEIEIRWASGTVQTIVSPEMNSRHTVIESRASTTRFDRE